MFMSILQLSLTDGSYYQQTTVTFSLVRYYQ